MNKQYGVLDRDYETQRLFNFLQFHRLKPCRALFNLMHLMVGVDINYTPHSQTSFNFIMVV